MRYAEVFHMDIFVQNVRKESPEFMLTLKRREGDGVMDYCSDYEKWEEEIIDFVLYCMFIYMPYMK